MAHGLWQTPDEEAGKSPVELTADPHVQLLGVVALLDDAEANDQTPYQKDVRSYFSDAKAAPAIQFLLDAKAAVEPDQELASASALSSFARTSEFKGFLRSHTRYYRQAIARFQRELSPAVSEWEAYTAVPVQPRQVAIAFGLRDVSSVCNVRNLDRSGLWIGADVDPENSAADIFSRTGISVLDAEVPNGNAQHLSITPEIDEQIVRAVFARIVALSAGEQAGKEAVRRQAADGYALVPTLADRLQQYEQHRDVYENLSDFLPTLVRGLDNGGAGFEATADHPMSHAANGPTISCHLDPANHIADMPKPARMREVASAGLRASARSR